MSTATGKKKRLTPPALKGTYWPHPKLKELKSALLDNQSGRVTGLVACCAEGGLGKTTLAYLLLNDAEIISKYSSRLVRQLGPDKRGEKGAQDFLRLLLIQTFKIDPKEVEEGLGNLTWLQSVWSEYVEDPIVLLVLDDVWDAEAFTHILASLPETVHTLVTCRNRSALAGKVSNPIELQFLTESQSVEVFLEKIPFDLKNNIPQEPLHRLVRLVCGHMGCLVSLAGQVTVIEDLYLLVSKLENLGLSEQTVQQTGANAEEYTRTIKAVYDVTWQALTEEEQQTLLKLSDLPLGLILTNDLLEHLLGLSRELQQAHLNRLKQLHLLTTRTVIPDGILSQPYTEYHLTDWTRQLAGKMGAIAHPLDWLERLYEAVEWLKEQAFYTPAGFLLEKILTNFQQEYGRNHPNYALLLMYLGSLYWEQGRYEDALEAFQEAEPELFKLGVEHPDYANLIMNMGIIYMDQGHYQDAIEAFHRAESVFLKLGVEHPAYARLMMSMGSAYREQARYQDALDAYHKAELGLVKLGTEQSDYAGLMQNIGIVYSHQECYEHALAAFHKAEPGLLKLGENHPKYAQLMMSIGTAYLRQGKYQDALENYQKAEPGMLILGEDHPVYAKFIMNMGLIHKAQGRYQDALEAFQMAKPGLLKLGAEHPAYARLMMNTGNVYSKQGRFPEALDAYHKAGAGMLRLGNEHWEYQDLLEYIKLTKKNVSSNNA